MVHFAGSTIFGHVFNPNDPINGGSGESFSTGGGLFGTSTVTNTSTGSIIPESDRLNRLVESAQTSTQNIIQTLTDRAKNLAQLTLSSQNLISSNLIGLGEASIDISTALNEQITIRETQRALDQEALNNQQIFTEALNERLSTQVSGIGESLSNIGQGGFDPIGFLTDNPIIGGIGIGGIAVGGIALVLLLKR